MEIKGNIKNLIKDALKKLKIEVGDIELEYPLNLEMGDYSTNIAMMIAKKEKTNPKELAEKIVAEILRNLPEEILKVEAKNGFINFYLSHKFFVKKTEEILEQKENFGKNNLLKGEKVIVEYTDPNPFKEFHIGHLMSNTIGEAISRVIEASGAEVKRACYQGDIGLHVAKTVWAMKEKNVSGDISISVLGEMYALGAKAYEGDEKTTAMAGQAKKEIEKINKEIYEKNPKIYEKYYLLGRKVSL
ncbi:arginine--tRNA ligase, partial [Patescibacteria group bacterium]|nr:arginine--tRNA ligase [Patescibacteria group bacterium]